jgi:hypothetical protein
MRLAGMPRGQPIVNGNHQGRLQSRSIPETAIYQPHRPKAGAREASRPFLRGAPPAQLAAISFQLAVGRRLGIHHHLQHGQSFLGR